MSSESTGRVNNSFSSDLYLSIFMQSPVCTAVFDSEFHLLNANNACLDFFNASSIADLQKISIFSIKSVTDENLLLLHQGKTITISPAVYCAGTGLRSSPLRNNDENSVFCRERLQRRLSYEKSQRIRFTASIVKPFKLTELMQMLEKYMKQEYRDER